MQAPGSVIHILLALLLCSPAHAKERSALPDAPVAKVTSEHRFYDKPGKILFTSALTVAAADAAQTCYFLQHGGKEDYLPTQHCPQVSLFIFGEVAAQEALAYFWHKTGHHKLERLTRFISIVDNTSGIVHSKRHGAL